MATPRSSGSRSSTADPTGSTTATSGSFGLPTTGVARNSRSGHFGPVRRSSLNDVGRDAFGRGDPALVPVRSRSLEMGDLFGPVARVGDCLPGCGDRLLLGSRYALAGLASDDVAEGVLEA